MSDHNLSARLWATAGLLAVPALSFLPWAGWWLPVHLVMLGAASQAIVGGQLMFSTTLALARGPSRQRALTQLAALNVAAALVISGRLWNVVWVLTVGASIFVLTIGWVTWQVNSQWRRSVNRRFAITGTFYTLVGLCVIGGASIGGALALGAFSDPSSYLAHRGVHLVFNILGWAGLTIVGTAITLLPTILHVRAPRLAPVRPVPWLMAGGLLLVATGATIDVSLLAGLGMAVYVAGLVFFGSYVRAMLSIPRRRAVPTGAMHLIAAVAWGGLTSIGLVLAFARADATLIRNLVVVGGAGGLVFQALMGAWSFLLPSTRAPDPSRRRKELIAMEIGGRSQVALYNLGLVLVLFELVSGTSLSGLGLALLWAAAAWALFKFWAFPRLAELPSVAARSEAWWAPPE
jgi:nitrite reductase (NO-forming)